MVFGLLASLLRWVTKPRSGHSPQSTRCQEGTKEKGEKQKVQVQSRKVTENAVTRDGLTPAHARIPAAPCTIANRFCSVGLEWADMQRSIHLVVRYVASLKRSASVMVAGTTSSSAMMMSAPGEQVWAKLDEVWEGDIT